MSGVGPALGRCCRFAPASLGLRPCAAALCRCAVVPAGGAFRVCACPALLRWRAASVLLGARLALVLGLVPAWPRAPCSCVFSLPCPCLPLRLALASVPVVFFRLCCPPCAPSRPRCSAVCPACWCSLLLRLAFFLLAVRPAPAVLRFRAPRRRSARSSLSPSVLLCLSCSSLPFVPALLGRFFCDRFKISRFARRGRRLRRLRRASLEEFYNINFLKRYLRALEMSKLSRFRARLSKSKSDA